jgi:hypothetical protein
MNKLPTIAELFNDNLEEAYKNEQLNLLLNQAPPANWVKKHPYIKDYNYLPIDKIEYLLRRVFKQYKIEVLREGTSFNGVYVVVRVHYLNPITNEMCYHDGIGAQQLQTKQGSSAADLANINNGALSMAFPIAKTIAIKDACDHFGTLFGANLNRKDTVAYTPDKSVIDAKEQRVAMLISTSANEAELMSIKEIIPVALQDQFQDKLNTFKK